MKRFIALLFVLIVPCFCLADMVGYSGDTRRYVTEAEKKQFPYNTVVRFMAGNGGTGTFISKSIILTCRHVVNDVGMEKQIDYLMADGQRRSAEVQPYIDDEEEKHDFGWVMDEGAFTGRVLDLAPFVPTNANNLMVIGYDSLKVLSKDELKIVKEVYKYWINKYGKLNRKNANEITSLVDATLLEHYACKTGKQKNCVKCGQRRNQNDWPCIFNDGDNMKVRSGCKITNIGDRIETNCPGSPGTSGAAFIDVDRKQIIGIFCQGVEQIGQEKDASSAGTRTEQYYKYFKPWVDVTK